MPQVIRVLKVDDFTVDHKSMEAAQNYVKQFNSNGHYEIRPATVEEIQKQIKFIESELADPHYKDNEHNYDLKDDLVWYKEALEELTEEPNGDPIDYRQAAYDLLNVAMKISPTGVEQRSFSNMVNALGKEPQKVIAQQLAFSIYHGLSSGVWPVVSE